MNKIILAEIRLKKSIFNVACKVTQNDSIKKFIFENKQTNEQMDRRTHARTNKQTYRRRDVDRSNLKA